VTAGIISALHRTISAGGGNGTPAEDLPDVLQTDAAINPGNSGGPLVNLDGEVVGLAALISEGPGGSYGYAVPINLVRRTATALIEVGHMPHPYIGVALRDVRELEPGERTRWGQIPERGALVSRIWRGAPAARAGLRPGDVITSLNNQDVPAAADVVDFVAGQDIGAHVVVGFVRQGLEKSVPLSLDELPSPELQDSATQARH